MEIADVPAALKKVQSFIVVLRRGQQEWFQARTPQYPSDYRNDDILERLPLIVRIAARLDAELPAKLQEEGDVWPYDRTLTASSQGRAVQANGILQRHATADRAASSIQRLPVAGAPDGVGMKSRQPQDAPQLLPADRVAGIFYRLPVLVQEGPALVCGQLIQDPLRVKRILTLGTRGAHGVIVTCGDGTACGTPEGCPSRTEGR